MLYSSWCRCTEFLKLYVFFLELEWRPWDLVLTPEAAIQASLVDRPVALSHKLYRPYTFYKKIHSEPSPYWAYIDNPEVLPSLTRRSN